MIYTVSGFIPPFSAVFFLLSSLSQYSGHLLPLFLYQYNIPLSSRHVLHFLPIFLGRTYGLDGLDLCTSLVVGLTPSGIGLGIRPKPRQQELK